MKKYNVVCFGCNKFLFPFSNSVIISSSVCLVRLSLCHWSVIPLSSTYPVILCFLVLLPHWPSITPNDKYTKTSEGWRERQTKLWDRELEGCCLVFSFQVYWLKEWWRMIEKMTLHHFLTKKKFGSFGRMVLHTHSCTDTCSNVDRKTACCQDGVFIYCFLSVSVQAP